MVRVGWLLSCALLLATPSRGLAHSPLPSQAKALAHQILEEAQAKLPGLKLRQLERRGPQIVVGLQLPEGSDLFKLHPEVENTFESLVGALSVQAPEVRDFQLLVALPHGDLKPPPRHQLPKDERQNTPQAHVSSISERFPYGQALAGKTIAISPGHGYIYYDSLGRYSTQRGNLKWQGCGDCRGLVEDFGSHQLAVGHLIPLLEGAGARVVLMRERDYGSKQRIVDDGDANYQEAAGSFSNGSSPGGHSGDYRAVLGPEGKINYTLSAPRSGEQWLSLWFVGGNNRVDAAELLVKTPNQDSFRFLLDQRSHGRRWAPVFKTYLEQGEELQIELSAPQASADQALIADAFRLSTGVHSSTHPWWSMGAAPFAAFQNAPAAVTTRGDVSVRPIYAEWYGADAYLSLHSNASGQPNSTAAGTSTYRYNCGSHPDHSRDPSADQCDDPVGSDRLQELIHSYMVAQIRQDWDPNWKDRGTRVANFGEVRNLSGIPGALVESAFHDNVVLPQGSTLRATDNQSLQDPRWRRAAAYGLYKGLSIFLAGPGPLLVPPPAEIAVRRHQTGAVELSFSEVSGARAYRVYVARGGRAFDQGQMFQQSPAIISGLPTDQSLAFKVAPINEAGEGLSTKVVSCRPGPRASQILVIDGFQREDAWVQEVDNRHDLLLDYGQALSSVEHSFDSATEEAWVSGLIDHQNYQAVILAMGRESTEHKILSPDLHAKLGQAFQGGTALFLAGSEVAWALDRRGEPSDKTFLANVFGVSYQDDDASQRQIAAQAGGLFENSLNGLDLSLAGPEGLSMETRSTDVFAASAGAIVELNYGAAGEAAGVRFGKNMVLGFSLANLQSPATRAAVLGGWVSETVPLGPRVEPLPDAGMPDLTVPSPDANTVNPDAGTIEPQEDAGVADLPSRRIKAGKNQEDPVQGGCGCSTHSASGQPSFLGFGLLLLLAWRRRR